MFATDRRACIFEYKIVDAEEKIDVLPWTLTTRTKGADVMDLLDYNWPWGTGPGFGKYLFYVRAIDPAGNVGYQYEDSNVYLWTWVDPLPLPWIIGGACAILFLMTLAYLEYRLVSASRKATLVPLFSASLLQSLTMFLMLSIPPLI